MKAPFTVPFRRTFNKPIKSKPRPGTAKSLPRDILSMKNARHAASEPDELESNSTKLDPRSTVSGRVEILPAIDLPIGVIFRADVRRLLSRPGNAHRRALGIDLRGDEGWTIVDSAAPA